MKRRFTIPIMVLFLLLMTLNVRADGLCDTEGHDYDTVIVDATETEDGSITYTCKRCGYSYSEVIPAYGHNYVESDRQEAAAGVEGWIEYKCSKCGDTYYEVIPALPVSATTEVEEPTTEVTTEEETTEAEVTEEVTTELTEEEVTDEITTETTTEELEEDIIIPEEKRLNGVDMGFIVLEPAMLAIFIYLIRIKKSIIDWDLAKRSARNRR